MAETRELQVINSSGEITEIRIGGVTDGNKVLTADEIEALTPTEKDFILFNTTPSTTSTEQGSMAWDADELTVGLIQNGTVLQLGQETQYSVRNDSGVDIADGIPVMATGTIGASGKVTIGLMDGTDATNTKLFLGITTEPIADGANGKVTHFGKVRGIDTSAFTDGDVIWISSTVAGELVNVKPTSPAMAMAVAFVVKSHTSGTLLVRVNNLDLNESVPYTGATTNVDIGAFDLDATEITADVSHSAIANMGDETGGNYAQFNANGELRLRGDATQWDDLRVPVTATTRQGSRDPDFTKFKDNGSGSQGVFAYLFNKTTEEELYFIAQMPHSWKQGSAIEAHVHWYPTVNGSAGTDVSWGMEYTWSNVGEVFGNTAIIYGDTNHLSETLVAGKHYITELGAIDATGKTFSSILVCRVFRDAPGAGGTDDYDADAGLLEIDFHYQIDSLGSNEEYIKY